MDEAQQFDWEFTSATDDLAQLLGVEVPKNPLKTQKATKLWAQYQTAHMAYIAQLNTVNIKAWEQYKGEHSTVQPRAMSHNQEFLGLQQSVYDDLLKTPLYQATFAKMINTFLEWLNFVKDKEA